MWLKKMFSVTVTENLLSVQILHSINVGPKTWNLSLTSRLGENTIAPSFGKD